MYFALIALLVSLPQTPLQTPLQDEPLTLPPIVYPAAARAAHIQGDVPLQVNVDARGNVTAVHALGGPEELRQAAEDAYAHATYRPVISAGKPTPAIITTHVHFALAEAPPAPETSLVRQFQVLHGNCQQLSLEHSADALAACRNAVDAGRKLNPSAQLETRAASYNDLVLLLIAAGKGSRQLPEAALLADQAVGLVTGSGVHQPAIATAYITRAEVRSLAGNLKGAAADCTTAEETLRTLLADEAETDKAAEYRGELRQLFELHAIILERGGKKDEARQIRHQEELV